MQPISIDQQSFNGKFSTKTLAKFQEKLTPEEFKQVKDFRAGKKFTNIDIVTVSDTPVRMSNGSVHIPKSTYADFSNTRKPSAAHGRIKLADIALPFNMNTFKMITKDLVKRGETLMEMFK